MTDLQEIDPLEKSAFTDPGGIRCSGVPNKKYRYALIWSTGAGWGTCFFEAEDEAEKYKDHNVKVSRSNTSYYTAVISKVISCETRTPLAVADTAREVFPE